MKDTQIYPSLDPSVDVIAYVQLAGIDENMCYKG
jgi:hypothetical protein